MHSENIEYASGDLTLKGYFARPSEPGPYPCVLVVHEWWGCNEYVRTRVDMLVSEGFAAMAIDLYGNGKTAANGDEAAALMNGLLETPNGVLNRFQAALDWVKARADVNTSRISAIGYCLGGAVVLNMARAGLDLNVVASFHGNLGTQNPASEGQIKARVAVFHGNDDVMIPAEQVTAFKAEMEAAKADHLFVGYDGAMHGFTNPLATERGQKNNLPLAYNEQADNDSWSQLLVLLKA
jgi:dienelactone hydrolase